MSLLRITLKDLRLILRDRWAAMSLLIVPVIIILVIAETQSGEGSSTILFPIVNEDEGPVANVLIRTLKVLSVRWEEEHPEDARLAARQEKSQPIVESFHQWLQDERLRQLPKSKLMGAINYMLNRWESFTRFLESGAIPMDNNAAERALKYPILGRKAWLFFGNQAAGLAAAKLFTLTKTCNRHRIDPLAYLQDVYARLPTTLPDELPSLLPDRWIEDHPQHLLQQRVYEALGRAQRARERRAERRRVAA